MKVRKAINFDLSTEAVKRHFGENTAPAYNSITILLTLFECL